MKNLVAYTLCALACCSLFLGSSAAVSAAGQGFFVWRDHVLPALLPFFVCAHVMQNLGLPTGLERWSLVLLALLSGAPSGARLLGAYPAQDSRHVAILNTVSPMYVYASFCGGMLGTPLLAPPIIFAMLAATCLMLLIFPLKLAPLPSTTGKRPLELVSSGLTGGISAMLNILAAMIFFMALLSAAKEALAGVLPDFGGLWGALCTGILEMVSGSAALAAAGLSPRITAAAAAFMFSFGGLCIFAQSLTFCTVSFGRYFAAKALQSAIAAAIAYFVCPLFLPDSAAVFAVISPQQLKQNALSLCYTAGVSLLAISAVFMLGAAARYQKQKRGP